MTTVADFENQDLVEESGTYVVRKLRYRPNYNFVLKFPYYP